MSAVAITIFRFKQDPCRESLVLCLDIYDSRAEKWLHFLFYMELFVTKTTVKAPLMDTATAFLENKPLKETEGPLDDASPEPGCDQLAVL